MSATRQLRPHRHGWNEHTLTESTDTIEAVMTAMRNECSLPMVSAPLMQAFADSLDALVRLRERLITENDAMDSST